MSLLYVSSKPGVSMRTIRLSSNSKGLETWTELVHDLSPRPMRKSEPLMRLTNEVLPLPVAPMTLWLISRSTAADKEIADTYAMVTSLLVKICIKLSR